MSIGTRVFNSTNIHEIYDNFLHTYNKILDGHIPRKVITFRPRDKLFMKKSIRVKKSKEIVFTKS